LTLLNDLLPRGIVILDASVLINLLGCGDPVAVLTGLEEKCLMEQRTLKEVRKHPIPGMDLKAHLSELFAAGTLEEVRMTEDEYETYLTFVSGSLGTRLDDGESAALAISGRGASIVLDERKARRRAGECAKALVVASTLQLMVTSGYRQSWSPHRVRDLVAAARVNSRMGVPKEDGALLEQLLSL
jgi:predicted nucleic acid-binding protein